MASDLVILKESQVKEVSESEGVSPVLAKQFFMISKDGNQLFIKRPGLLYKMEHKYKETPYSILAVPPTAASLRY